MRCTFSVRTYNLLRDVFVDVKVHQFQMFLILSGVGFHWDQCLVDCLLDLFSEFLHGWLMGSHRLQQRSTRPEYVLQYVLKKKSQNLKFTPCTCHVYFISKLINQNNLKIYLMITFSSWGTFWVEPMALSNSPTNIVSKLFRFVL